MMKEEEKIIEREKQKSSGEWEEESAAGAEEAACSSQQDEIPVKTLDEAGELCSKFNEMYRTVKEGREVVKRVNKAYSRFVPGKFRKYLGKTDIIKIERNDQRKIEQVPVMFSNIRSFYSYVMSEGISNEESFKYINDFLGRIGPVIPEKGGFVDKYLGAGIMALFPEKPEESIEAALKMRKELEIFNAERELGGQKTYDIGIGIHSGDLMLGIVGEAERLEGAVISSTVNFAEALERLTSRLGACILVTGAVPRYREYQHRSLGVIRLGDGEKKAEVYDVYQGDPEKIRKLKEETKVLFQKGVDFYGQGDFAHARELFVEVIKRNPYDEAAKVYFLICNRYYEEYSEKGLPEKWDGTLVLEEAAITADA